MKIKKIFIELMVLIAVMAGSVPLLKPKIATLINNKGVDYCSVGKIDKAIPLFKKSLKIRPDPQVYCNLANAYREKKMSKEAIVEYKKALQLDSNYIEAYYRMAYSYEDEGMYKDAISYLEKVESFDSDRAREELEDFRFIYASFLFNEAADFYIEGDKSKATSKLKEVIGLKPDFTFAYKMLGDIKFSENLFAEAIANYKQTIELGLEGASIYNLYNDIGICYMRLENYTESLKYLSKAHKLEPTNTDILYNFASTLRDNRNFAEALEKYRELVKINFNYPNVHNDMADIYKSIGKTEETQREYNNEIEVVQAELSRNPGNIYDLNRLALAYNGLGRYEEAKKIIDSVIKKRPDYGEAYYTRAKVYENLGKGNEALNDLEKARKFFPKAEFIDNYILRLKTKKTISKDKGFFSNDIIIYLTNGRQIEGRLKQTEDERVFLEVMVGNSFGTIAIEQKDIQSLKKLK